MTNDNDSTTTDNSAGDDVSAVHIIKRKRGFAALSAEVRREISSRGGKAVQNSGKAHRYNSETGKAAGHNGGTVVSTNREYMREIGRKGGMAKRAVKKDEQPVTNDVVEE